MAPLVTTKRRCLPVVGSALFLGAVFTLSTAAAVEPSTPADRFQAHIDYLASDKLEGRGVGSQGIEAAAEYIAKQFRELGLEPAGEDGTYFQTLSITLHRTLSDQSRLAFNDDPDKRLLGRDFIPFNFSSEDAFDGAVVFVGYGIVARDKQRDDFAHADVQGKIALMFRGEPPSWADAEGAPSHHAFEREKVYNAKDRGAVAVLMVNQKPAPGEIDELTEFVAAGAEAYGIPAFHLRRVTADAMLAKGGLSLPALQEKLDEGGYASSLVGNLRVVGQAAFRKNDAKTRNVIGIRRGSGPRADEVVVIGAHYDHLGLQRPMGRKFKAGQLVRESNEPQIHNGADDNASGTSALIEIARMFAAGPPTERSILFIAFTAEESGLHGSKYYVDHPTRPLDKTVAMLNLDMVGRMPPDSHRVHAFGVESAKELAAIVTDRAAKLDLTVTTTGDPGGRSDHAVFVRQKIPSLHFFSGQHSDYHKPTDDCDKINAEGGARIAALVYGVAFDLAARPTALTYQEVKTATSPTEGGGTPTYKVVMGLAPGYADDGQPGMAVESVNPEGPADLAGMKAGDRIIRIGGKKVANIYDYMAATRGNKAGDAVEVVVLRDGKELALQVKLAAAK